MCTHFKHRLQLTTSGDMNSLKVENYRGSFAKHRQVDKNF